MVTPGRHDLVPDPVLAYGARGPAWASFVDTLPRLIGELLEEWELSVDGPSMHGYCAVVVPVLGARHRGPAVLKVGFVDDESEHEALALQRWAGRGAVRLLQADPRRGALLLERLPGPDLAEVWDVEACEIIGGLYADLHRPAPAQLRPLTSYVGRWLDDLAALPRSAPLPRRLVEQSLSAGRDLVADPASVGRLIHGDLHFANVLAVRDDRWLAIDPKPVSGDPHYEPAPLLWNRWDEIVASGDLRSAVRRRFHAVVDAAGLDEDRARDWVVVRMLINASWEIDDADWLTRCVTIAKAVQD